VGGALVLPLRVSYRDREEMLTERGVAVDHTTIYRWIQRYAPELDKQTRWYRRVCEWRAQSWRVEETYLRIGGKWCYWYRALTSRGDTLEFSLSTRATHRLSEAVPGQDAALDRALRAAQNDHH
jgi:IS6 family transposase